MTSSDRILKEKNSSPGEGEKRRTPRVAAGRPGRMRFSREEEERSISCSIVDVSADGCRILVPRRDLPRDWIWAAGSMCDLTIRIDARQEVPVRAELMWAQRTQEDFDIIGFRFAKSDADLYEILDKFVVLRLHAGLGLQDPTAEKKEAGKETLEYPLEADAWEHDRTDLPPYRFALHTVTADRLLVRHATKTGEEKRVPPSGSLIDITIYPPVWARGQKRALRFASKVEKSDGNGAELSYHAEGNDLAHMILSLIPDKIERKAKPKEIDIQYVLLILAAIVIALMIASLN
jgi:hypothetical protein